ncbi:MAG TPA: transcription elongation factor GreA [Candidatus Limnocylindrales bacterium]|nr:transcription elongation factor GreA [Candidatus Limnocylindrales bacterium]
MSRSAGATGLFRTVGLMNDGPVAWGTAVRSTKPGVYVIELPNAPDTAPIDIGLIGNWLSGVPTLRLNGARPSGKELAARLASFWLPGEPILYIGRSNASLAGRVNAYYRTPLGDPKPHAGGHWIKTLSMLDETRVWWAETDAAEEAELSLIEAFADGVDPESAAALLAGSPVLPFANLVMPTGERRPHGITGSVRAKADGESSAVVAGRARSAHRSTKARTSTRTTRSKAVTPTAAQIRAGEPVHLTPDGMAALEAELASLRTERRPAAIVRVATARELGDLKENAEYHAAREELGFIEGRIKSLEDRHKRAVVMVASDGSKAVMGSVVIVESDGERTEYTLVNSAEARPSAGRISVSSPVGQAIVGAKPGDEVTVRSPAGEHRLRVVEIR